MNLRFENDVKTYGTETEAIWQYDFGMFENDVKTYGTETKISWDWMCVCLRMM